MKDQNFRNGDAKTAIFGSNEMLQPSPVDKIPDGPTTPQIAYQMVKDETFAQTQPRLNLATFVTTYMDDYATKLMNEAIDINYIDETEYPRIAVMNAKCINIIANLWNTPEQAKWKSGALAIGSSEACMLGGVAAWLRWRKKGQTDRQTEFRNLLRISSRVGKIRPIMANRDETSSIDSRKNNIRSRSRTENVR